MKWGQPGGFAVNARFPIGCYGRNDRYKAQEDTCGLRTRNI